MKTILALLTSYAVLLLPAVAQPQDESKTASKPTSSPAMQMHRDMMSGSKESMAMKPTGDIDRDFVMMMRHHHQTGVQMSEHQIKNGKDPKVREVAQKIADSQRQEIKEFDQWLKSKGHDTPGHGEPKKRSSK